MPKNLFKKGNHFAKGRNIGNDFAKGNTARRNPSMPQPFISPHHTDLISLWWTTDSSGYYRREFKMPDGTKKKLSLHCIILERKLGHAIPKGMKCDHIDINPRNNLDNNLRQVTASQSSQNRRFKATNNNPYRGVCWIKKINKWRACVGGYRKRFFLGHFETAELANDVCIAKRLALGFLDSSPVTP